MLGGLQTTTGSNQLGYTLALLSGALWGVGAVVLGEALAHRPLAAAGALFAAPLAAAALHDCLALVWVSAVSAAAGRLRATAAALRTRDGLVVCLAALIGGPLAMSTYLLAIAFAGAPYAIAIASVFPALGALFGYAVLHERLGGLGLVGVALAVGGAVLASYAPPAGASPHYLLGALCAVTSAAGWAAEGVLVTRSMARMPALAALNIREAVSAGALLLIVLPSFAASGVAARTVATPTMAILVAASLCGAGSYLFYYRSLDLLGAARAMPANSTSVLWTIALSLAVTGAWPGWRLVVGGFVVMAGIALVATDRRSVTPLATTGA
jgi:drug/metabolite transporter (DMT)-like permease